MGKFVGAVWWVWDEFRSMEHVPLVAMKMAERVNELKKKHENLYFYPVRYDTSEGIAIAKEPTTEEEANEWFAGDEPYNIYETSWDEV